MTTQEARALGYVRGVRIEIGGDIRTMTSGRIIETNGNLLAMGSNPFWIYFRNHWTGRILKHGTVRASEVPAS